MSSLSWQRMVLISLGLGVLVWLASPGTARGGTPLDPDTIKAMLRTATPEEDGFIEQVVTMVQRGTLPRDLFDSTLLWARRKPRRKFQYFKFALTARAAEIGITL